MRRFLLFLAAWTAFALPYAAAAPRYSVGSPADVKAKTLRATHIDSQAATSGQALTADGAGGAAWITPTHGTVTSIGLGLPGEFTVSGSPVTGSGTLTGAWASQSADLVFASPSGSSGIPGFRALTDLDLPAGTGTLTDFTTGTWPSWLTPSVTNPTTTPQLSVSAATIPIAAGGTGATSFTTNDLIDYNGSTFASVSVGSGLSLSGSTLSATGGGGAVPVTLVVAAVDSDTTNGANATCDGTADEVEIQAAIDTCAARGGGIVALREGTYTQSAPVNLKSGVSLVALGAGVTLKRGFANANLYFAGGGSGQITIGDGGTTAVSDAEVRGITFDGQRATYTTGGPYGILLKQKCSRVKITDCTFTNQLAEEIVGYSNSTSANANVNCTFEGNVSTNGNDTYGIHLHAASNTRLTGHILRDNRMGQLFLERCDAPIIEGNRLINGIYLSLCTQARVMGNTVLTPNTGDSGCVLDNSQDGQVVGNTFQGTVTSSSDVYGVQIINGSDRTTVTGNRMDTVGTGLYINNGNDCKVQGNRFSAIEGFPVFIQANRAAVEANTITNYNTDPDYQGTCDGIYVTGGGAAAGCRIRDNTLFNPAGSPALGVAIHLNAGAAPTGCTLAGNLFSGPGAAAITDGGSGTVWAMQWDGTNLVTKGQAPRFQGFGEASGLVWTSDANGVGSWQDLATVNVAHGGTGATAFTAGTLIGANASTTTGAMRAITVGTGLSLSGSTLSTVGGVGGSGNVTFTSALASPPGSPNAGDLWLPSDAFQLYRYDGSAWADFGPVDQLVQPADTGFSWVNQGSSTITTAHGVSFLTAPASATDAWSMRVKTAPATPYSLIVRWKPALFAVDYSGAAIVWRQSSNGLWAGVGHYNNVDLTTTGQMRLNALKGDATPKVSANYVDIGTPGWWEWVKLRDDGTNRIISVSRDGQNWLQLHTIGRTDYITADQIGFAVESRNATYPAGVTIESWVTQ